MTHPSPAVRRPKGRPLRIAVVGNCQAGGIADALNILADGVTAVPFMVHTLTEAQRPHAFNNLRKYDLLLSQPIQSFGPLNTDKLLTLGKPLITFPNVYFRGPYPDICFVGPGGTAFARRWQTTTASLPWWPILKGCPPPTAPRVSPPTFITNTVMATRGKVPSRHWRSGKPILT